MDTASGMFRENKQSSTIIRYANWPEQWCLQIPRSKAILTYRSAELTTEFTKWIRRVVLRTSLKSKNICKAFNPYACSALESSFRIINCTKIDLENLQRKVRTLLRKVHKCHLGSAIARITLPRYLSERGLVDIGKQLDHQIENLLRNKQKASHYIEQ